MRRQAAGKPPGAGGGMVVCFLGLPGDFFVIRRFRGKGIGSGDSEERGEPERASGLPSIIAVLRDCLGTLAKHSVAHGWRAVN